MLKILDCRKIAIASQNLAKSDPFYLFSGNLLRYFNYSFGFSCFFNYVTLPFLLEITGDCF